MTKATFLTHYYQKKTMKAFQNVSAHSINLCLDLDLALLTFSKLQCNNQLNTVSRRCQGKKERGWVGKSKRIFFIWFVMRSQYIQQRVQMERQRRKVCVCEKQKIMVQRVAWRERLALLDVSADWHQHFHLTVLHEWGQI